ncbi:hypothetical protein Tco_0684512 [Tanacetum coccineum]
MDPPNRQTDPPYPGSIDPWSWTVSTWRTSDGGHKEGMWSTILGFVTFMEKLPIFSKACLLGLACVGAWPRKLMSTWMVFGGNTRDLSSFREETDEITDLHQVHKEVLFKERGDGVTGIKRRNRDLSSDGVRILTTTQNEADLKKP